MLSEEVRGRVRCPAYLDVEGNGRGAEAFEGHCHVEAQGLAWPRPRLCSHTRHKETRMLPYTPCSLLE